MKDKLSLIPHEPGCYLMKSINGDILYVGKAKNLYNRLRSYFVGSHDTKTTKLISQITDFEYIITSSEVEAFILEINLIKKYKPKYNILLTDDKSYPYIYITDEAHPRLIYLRDINKKKGKYYGPYPNSGAASMVAQRLNKIFPFRKCRIIPKKECLYYHLGMCLAPCINEVSPDVYQEMRSKVDRLLRGNAKDEIKNLKVLMEEAAHNLDFEKAIEYRNLINDLNIISQKQLMEGYNFEADVFGYYLEDNKISIQVFHLREGKVLERQASVYDIEGNNDFFSEYIVRFYLELNNPIPQTIIATTCNQDLIEEALNKTIIIPKKGKNKDLVNLVNNNAQNKLDVLVKLEERKVNQTIIALENIRKLLHLSQLKRIEAFDNSNISGASPVSAMIVYEDHRFNKKEYRKFLIKTVIGANDVETMYEVISRRYKDLSNAPDLIIVDGGKAQVNAALSALESLQRVIPVIGLVKDDKHQTNAIYYNFNTYNLLRESPEYRLLERIQNEVHRYAITFFRQTHTKNLISSELDNIKGIGAKKKAAILKIVGEENFAELLTKLPLNSEQINEIQKIFSSK